MQALYIGPGGLDLRRDHPRPQAAPGEALVRVSTAGICATDLELVSGYAGFEGVPGHEFVGVVEEAPDRDWIDRRVVGSINVGCGDCAECRGASPGNGPGGEHCPRRTVVGIRGRDGAFAEYLTLPVANLLPVPDGVADSVAVFTEPLAAALRILEQVETATPVRSSVLGPGRLGLLAAQVLALDGSPVTVLGRRRRSLELPRRLGLAVGLASEAAAGSFDLVVEATGNAGGLAEALRLVRPRGTVVLKSTFASSTAVDLSKLVVAEIRVLGSRCGPLAPALRLLAAERVEVRPLVEAEYPLGEGLSAFAHAARPGVRKILLTPGAPGP